MDEAMDEPMEPEVVREPMPGRAVQGHGRPPIMSNAGRKKGVPLRISTQQLAIALITANGDRKLVAEQLGVKLSLITMRINANPQLKARFGHKSLKIRQHLDLAKMEREGKTPLDQIGIIERTMEEQVVGIAGVGNMALTGLQRIEERLKLGREARMLSAIPVEELTPEQKRFVKENELDYDANGVPVEEKVLLDQRVALIREYTRTAEIVSQIAYKKVVTEQLMRKMGGARNSRPKPTLASAPKTVAVTNITHSQVVVQSPNPEAVDG